MAKQPGDQPPCSRELPPRHDPRIVAMNHGNLPQQVSFLDRRIILGHAVAARDQKLFLAQTALAHDAMNKQTSTASVEHEITRMCFLKSMGLNGKAIAWPQSRQHADSAGSQLQLSCALQHLCRQTAFARVLRWGSHGTAARTSFC